jgi:cytochrome c oxidase assembly factor CtaG
MRPVIAPLLHAAATSSAWTWEPGIAVPLVLTAVLYTRGVRALWSHGRQRGVSARETGAFALGLVVLMVALLSPLHEASEQIFSAHMIQHELLMVVAAPLLVVGRPAIVMLWSVPVATRQAIGRAVRQPAFKNPWKLVSRPFDAWMIHAVAIWCWHIPSLFQATLHSEAIHALQHLSFVASALLFWYAVIHPRRRAALGMSILYLFTTAVHTAVLGALMTFSRSPWYPDYALSAVRWGMSPAQDQQVAGLMMWIPASIAYLVAALMICRRWLRDSELLVSHAERSALSS